MISILKEMNCPDWVISHSKAVNLKAISLSKNLSNKFDIDMDLVREGALVHDIGRCMTDGIYHAVVGAEILKSEEYPLEIIKIVERHIGAGIPKEEAIEMGLPAKDFIPQTLEEKIVAHADNLLHGDQEVDINFVIEKWSSRMGKDHPSIERLIRLHQEIVISSK